jgi:antirestriction protein ArdC
MTSKETKPRAGIYARITDRIVADLEHGVRPWVKPWSAANAAGRIMRPLRHNSMPYQGINVVLLWSEAVARGFTSPIWMTFKQALELGGHIRKGETGTMVVYANKITRTETDEHGDDVERTVPFVRGYTVFCVDQIDDLPDHRAPRSEHQTGAASGACRRLLRQHRCKHRTRRRQGILRAGARPDPSAAVREFP